MVKTRHIRRHRTKDRGCNDEWAPGKCTPGVYTAGQAHDRCHGMRFLEQIHTLVVLGDGGVCRGSAGSRGVGGEEGSRLKTCTFVRASMGIDLCPDALVKAIW